MQTDRSGFVGKFAYGPDKIFIVLVMTYSRASTFHFWLLRGISVFQLDVVKHALARSIGLILVPIIIYISTFYIHFSLFSKGAR